MSTQGERRTEIISVASGKGGTGKTVLLATLGYALQRSGLKVLFVDTDTSTDGLSLFLLGPHGKSQLDEAVPANIFADFLRRSASGELGTSAEPFEITVSPMKGRGSLACQALLSSRGLYGTLSHDEDSLVQPLSSEAYRFAIRSLFHQLRESNKWDYILVDTRGGFSSTTVDVCALSDSFFFVVEPNPSSFFQEKNLFRRIEQAGNELQLRMRLRGVIVNKTSTLLPTPEKVIEDDSATFIGRIELNRIEMEFRTLAANSLRIRYSDTYPVPLDIDAMDSYMWHSIPLVAHPGSLFSYAALTAFSHLMRTVTVQWQQEVKAGWNGLIAEIAEAVEIENNKVLEDVRRQRRAHAERVELSRDNENLKLQIEDMKSARNHAFESEKIRLARDREVIEAQSRQYRVRLYVTAAASIALFLVLSATGMLYVQAERNDIAAMQIRERELEKRAITAEIKNETLTARLSMFPMASETSMVINNWLWPAARFVGVNGQARDINGTEVHPNPDRLSELDRWLKAQAPGVSIPLLVNSPDLEPLRANAIHDLNISRAEPG
jgi:MinD-like ATPase involved in chromosome partitioning or flagellar assembly